MARPATIRYQPNGAKVWRPEGDERAHDEDRGGEGGERRHRDLQAERAVDPVVGLVEVERGGAQHGRDGQEERELGRGAPVEAHDDGAHDRSPRARTRRDHRDRLAEPDRQRDARHLGRVVVARVVGVRSIRRMTTPPSTSATATTQAENR